MGNCGGSAPICGGLSHGFPKMTAQRKEEQKHIENEPPELCEYKTRKLYIDAMLMNAGWVEGRDWINEVELSGMPNKAGKGYADYVIYDKVITFIKQETRFQYMMPE